MIEARTLIIACGALAREIVGLVKANGLVHLDLRCLPATLHNRPEQIASAVRDAIREARASHARIFVAYADCGTGGALDEVLREEKVERLAGPHCYATFAGQDHFRALAEAEPGSLYLTDFLVRQFETLIVAGLGLDRHPELRDLYFKNYTRVVYLAQSDDHVLTGKARTAAERLGLEFERVGTGMGELETFIRKAADGALDGRPHDPLLAGHTGPGGRKGRAQDGQEPARSTVRAGDRPCRHARRAHRDRRLSGPVAQV